MMQRKIYPLLLALLTLVGILVSGCTQVVIGPPGSGAGSSLTALQVLQNSENAMRQLKSSHIDLQSHMQIQGMAPGGVAPLATPASTQAVTPAVTATPATTVTPTAVTPTPATTVTPTPGTAVTPVVPPTAVPANLAVSIVGSGDEVSPDQERLQLTINQSNVAEVAQGDKVFVQNAQGPWYVLNKNDLVRLIGNPLAGVHLDQNSLLGLIQHASVSDHGDENLNGQSLRHITADLDKEALRQILIANPQLQGMLGQQDLNALLNNVKAFQASFDVWIDETQFYVHRSQLKFNLTASGLNTSAASTQVASLNTIVDLSKFNVPVTITLPPNAIPTTNPGAIIGIGTP